MIWGGSPASEPLPFGLDTKQIEVEGLNIATTNGEGDYNIIIENFLPTSLYQQ